MKTKRWGMFTQFFFSLLGLFLVMSLLSDLHAAGYPDRAITIVVAFAPGGNTDLSARVLAARLEKQLKQPVVVVNKPGGAATVGGYSVVSAKPDGYTLGFFTDVTTIPEIFTYFFEAPYSSKDLRPICNAFFPVLACFVNGDAPWNSMKEFVEYARKNPGMKWGHSGKATPGYFSMTLVNKTEKIGFVDLTFDGDAKLVPAVLGDHVPIGVAGFAGVKSLYESKKVKLLAFVTIPNRAPFAPEVPTFTELGYKMTTFPYQGLFAPRGVPDEVVKKINEAVSKVAEDHDFQNEVKAMGAYFNYESTTSFEKSLMEYKEAYHAFLKEWGMVK